MAVENWLNHRKAQGLANSTIERNRSSFDSILGKIGKSIRLTRVTTKMVDDYRDYMVRRGYKAQGININLRTLTTFFNWAERRDLIMKKPYVDKIKVNDDDYRYFSDTDFAKILSNVLIGKRPIHYVS